LNLRPTPSVATWFLNQFGPASVDESELGDLVERYQRGHGRLWYWRQVLAIVYGELYQQFRSHKRQFIAGLIRTWCLWGGLQFAAGVVLLAMYALRTPMEGRVRIWGFPLLALDAGMGPWLPAEWSISLLYVLLNLLPLALVGRVVVASSRNHSRAMLLMFVTTFVVATAGSAATQILQLIQNQPNAPAFLLIDLVALPLAPALLLFGGMRGLSPLPPQIKGEKA
jgi:hypothetical protein